MADLRVDLLNHSVPNAYHGTSLEGARSIKAEGFKSKKSLRSYLGDGVYFYEGSVNLARNHATKRRRLRKYAIIQATIQLGRCLDLNTPEHCRILRIVRSVLIKRKRENPEDLTDAFIINWYAYNVEKELDTIKWTLTKLAWEQIYPKSLIRYTEPIICVRNVERISDISVIEERKNEKNRNPTTKSPGSVR